MVSHAISSIGRLEVKRKIVLQALEDLSKTIVTEEQLFILDWKVQDASLKDFFLIICWHPSYPKE